ncbi:MAG: hypothetical protein ACI9W2_005304 [Gammaproteobacteria bacterium]|jgi:hypothetical protein
MGLEGRSRDSPTQREMREEQGRTVIESVDDRPLSRRPRDGTIRVGVHFSERIVIHEFGVRVREVTSCKLAYRWSAAPDGN